jgi:hypothetical protein
VISCEYRPGYLPDSTVRAGRRSDDLLWSAPAGPTEEALGCGLECLPVGQVLLSTRGEHHRLPLYYGRLGYLVPYLRISPTATSA